ncbi:MAG: hypothetical protein WCT10_04270 [Patescibacteria group bacterium]|jgi:hypothetical protein
MNFIKGFAPFLDYRYWLNPNPVPLGPSLVGGILIFFLWFLVVAAILAIIARSLKRDHALKAGVFNRFASLLFWTGFLGLASLFCAYEQVPLFGMRFWFLLTFTVLLVWLVRVVIYVARDYPRLRTELDEKKRLAKYLPGANR